MSFSLDAHATVQCIVGRSLLTLRSYDFGARAWVVQDGSDRFRFADGERDAAYDCYRRLRDGYRGSGLLVTERGVDEGLIAFADRHAALLRREGLRP